jgi:disulfide oxidoreductase YuzD
MVEHIQDLIKKKNSGPPWGIDSTSILRDLSVPHLNQVINFISSFEDIEGLIAKNKEHIEENNKKIRKIR